MVPSPDRYSGLIIMLANCDNSAIVVTSGSTLFALLPIKGLMLLRERTRPVWGLSAVYQFEFFLT
jgi:hypothetical protein